MGMEALETAVGYWEDALAAYHPRAGSIGTHAGVLTTSEETKFIRMLESILEGAFQLQVNAQNICQELFTYLWSKKANYY